MREVVEITLYKSEIIDFFTSTGVEPFYPFIRTVEIDPANRWSIALVADRLAVIILDVVRVAVDETFALYLSLEKLLAACCLCKLLLGDMAANVKSWTTGGELQG